MKPIKIAAAVLNQTPLDWDGNQRHIIAAIAEARAQGAVLLCLPELCICGYGCEDMFHAPGVHDMSLRVLEEIIPESRGIITCVGLPLMHHNALFNTVAILADGKLLGFVAKQNLAGDGIHYEPRWFKAWPKGRRARVEVPINGPAREVPIGDVLFTIGGVKIGVEICEDAWVAQRPGAQLARRGVDVILNPSASHFAFGKIDVRRRFVLEGSRAFGVSYLYANQLGNEAGRAIYDGGALIASAGKLLAAGPRFGFRDVYVTSAVIDIDATRMIQARTGSFHPDVDDDAADSAGIGPADVTHEFDYPEAALEPAAAAESSEWETSTHIKEEEFTRAEALGLFDYLRKSRSRGFVISLSGGADSSACAVLVAMMVRLATKEIGNGSGGFAEKLSAGEAGALAGLADVKELTARLLTCVYQKTRNSSATTENAARGVAEAIGARFMVFDVDGLVEGYRELVEAGIGRQLDWTRDDVTLQNIQARARAPSIWMLANIENALLLSTSNRSEAAVGYATMDGDTAGGLSPIAGIDKAFLRQWLRWMEKQGPCGLVPVGLAALAAVNRQAPTAELRPAAACQTDEDDLMPYELLDAIERAAVRDKLMPLDVFQQMRAAFPQYGVSELGRWIERFFTLWCRNQWKRERYAPSFHLDDENLDPKTWCRFPILSGGYRRELDELRAWLEELETEK